MSKCKTVTLRKRKIKNGTQYSLCLDYYPGYRDNTTMKVITREALGIYIFAKPANQQERDFNARMMKKAEILRNRRYEAIFNENNGFFDKARMKGDFLAYFKELADRRNIPGQPSCYRLGLVAVKAHPLVDLGTDMVDGLLVCNTGHDEVDVLHDHADPFRLFLLLSVLVYPFL